MTCFWGRKEKEIKYLLLDSSQVLTITICVYRTVVKSAVTARMKMEKTFEGELGIMTENTISMVCSVPYGICSKNCYRETDRRVQSKLCEHKAVMR